MARIGNLTFSNQFAAALADATALAANSTTQASTATGVGAGMAIGAAGSVAAATGTYANLPQISATTAAQTSTGDVNSFYHNDTTIVFGGHSTVSAAQFSITFSSSLGNYSF